MRPRRYPSPVRERYRRAIDEQEGFEVPGRLGASFLTGRAAEVYKDFDPAIFCLPPAIPLNEEFVVWDRKWIVKPSSLGPNLGYGLFALEDIVVPHPCRPFKDDVPLFPYCGAVYKRRAWNSIVSQHPSWSTYQLDLDSDENERMVRPAHRRVVDGDPVRCGNMAGYINSTEGLKPARKPNVEWQQFPGPPPPPYYTKHMDDHVVMVAIRTIRAGEEILCAYPFGLGRKMGNIRTPLLRWILGR
jgi:hypothetical protein